MGAILTAIFYYKGPTQDLDGEEPIIDYITEDSRLAGIQFLTQNGLTVEQYEDTCEKLTNYFNENYPNANYFSYVNDSLQILTPEYGFSEDESYLSPEEEAELLASIAAADPEEEARPEIESYIEERENDGIGNAEMSFEMESDNGDRFEIRLSFPEDPKKVNIEVNKK